MIVLSVVFISTMTAQNHDPDVWNNRKCAVALTYDDGLNVHLDKVIPVLDSAGFKATFYLTGYREGLGNRMADWRIAADRGHELGNHTLFHPCVAVAKDRDYSGWVIPEYDLNNYTVTRMVDEIRMANVFLKAIDGKDQRTIAYPCGDCYIHDSSYVPLIRDELAGGRGGSGMTGINKAEVFHIPALFADDTYTGEQLIDSVRKAIDTNSLLVFCFHGVGGEHATNITLDKHNELVHFLEDTEKEIWVAPLIEIAVYIKKYQENVSR